MSTAIVLCVSVRDCLDHAGRCGLYVDRIVCPGDVVIQGSDYLPKLLSVSAILAPVDNTDWKIVADPSGSSSRAFSLTGDWTLETLARRARLEGGGGLVVLEQKMVAAADGVDAWDLRGVSRLDSAAALLLWRVWGGRRPRHLLVDEGVERAIVRVESAGELPTPELDRSFEWVVVLGRQAIAVRTVALGMIALVGQLLLDTRYLLIRPRELPWREFSASIVKTGVMALPITGLLGLLVGVVMSYLLAQQLTNFGAEVFVVNILGYGILREFGPVLMAVLVAGRSGSAITAQLGLMRVTEEFDALATMGISRSLRLVLPRVLALSIVGPLLALWTSAAAIFGGMLAADALLNIDFRHFFFSLPDAVPFLTVCIGLIKGGVFCAMIGLIGCYFGLTVKPNTESLSARTTTSVVVSITMVIVVDSILAIMTSGIGVPF